MYALKILMYSVFAYIISYKQNPSNLNSGVIPSLSRSIKTMDLNVLKLGNVNIPGID